MSSPFQKKFSSGSPLLQGAYESAADNDVYLSTQPQQQQLQNALTSIGVAAGKEFSKPENKAKRQDKRVKRRGERTSDRVSKAEKNKDNWSPKKLANYKERTGRMLERTGKVAEKSVENKKQAKDNAYKNRDVYDANGNRIKYKDIYSGKPDAAKSDTKKTSNKSYFPNGGWTDTVTTEEDRRDELANKLFGESKF